MKSQAPERPETHLFYKPVSNTCDDVCKGIVRYRYPIGILLRGFARTQARISGNCADLCGIVLEFCRMVHVQNCEDSNPVKRVVIVVTELPDKCYAQFSM